MKSGEKQKLYHKRMKEGQESFSSDGYHCILTEYVNSCEVYVTFDDGSVKKTRYDRFKSRCFSKHSHTTKEFWDDYRMNGTKLVPTELLVKDFLEEMSFEHQVSLCTKEYIDRLIYNNVPSHYVYDFVSHKYHLIIEIDGRTHESLEAQKIDRNKECLAYLQGYKVFRFKNRYVKDFTEEFKLEVKSLLKGVVL